MNQPSIPWDVIFGLVAYGVGVLLSMIPLHIIVSASWRLVEAEAVRDHPSFWHTIHAALRRYIWQGLSAPSKIPVGEHGVPRGR